MGYRAPEGNEEKERRRAALIEGQQHRRELERLGVAHRKPRKDTVRKAAAEAAKREAQEAERLRQLSDPACIAEAERQERIKLWIKAYREKHEAKALAKYNPTRGKKRTPPPDIAAEMEAEDEKE